MLFSCVLKAIRDETHSAMSSVSSCQVQHYALLVARLLWNQHAFKVCKYGNLSWIPAGFGSPGTEMKNQCWVKFSKLPKADIDQSVILDVTAKLSIRRRPGCTSTHWRWNLLFKRESKKPKWFQPSSAFFPWIDETQLGLMQIYESLSRVMELYLCCSSYSADVELFWHLIASMWFCSE